MITPSDTVSSPPAIQVNNLTFSYPSSTIPVLQNINISLPYQSRTLLLGFNGCGKSTLLKLLAGKHMVSDNSVQLLEKDAFRDFSILNNKIRFLDLDWGMRSVAFGASAPLMADIPVHAMMSNLQQQHPERRSMLMSLLNINPNWRMHHVSSGQRRRVQLFLAFLQPFQLLLLDEVTVSLDLCMRHDLLNWLIQECQDRNATMVYATHIMDTIDWATHVLFLRSNGNVGWFGSVGELEAVICNCALVQESKVVSMAYKWLREEMVMYKKEKKYLKEKESGEDFWRKGCEDPNNRQGGYASGRLGRVDEEWRRQKSRSE